MLSRDWTEQGWQDGLGRFDLILANPPYVEADAALQPSVRRFEPAGALFAGGDGLDDYRVLIPQLPALLSPNGIAVIEIGAAQADPVRQIAERAGFSAELHKDLAGRRKGVGAAFSAWQGRLKRVGTRARPAVGRDFPTVRPRSNICVWRRGFAPWTACRWRDHDRDRMRRGGGHATAAQLNAGQFKLRKSIPLSNNNRNNNNRRRGRGSNRSQGGGQSNRIDSRARGNAPQLLEKYRKLAQIPR